MDAERKLKKYFDGSTDVEAFITITELNAAVKGYADEKKAQYMASLLVEGPALNVYLRLDEDKRKNPEEIKTALRNEFEAEKLLWRNLQREGCKRMSHHRRSRTLCKN